MGKFGVLIKCTHAHVSVCKQPKSKRRIRDVGPQNPQEESGLQYSLLLSK